MSARHIFTIQSEPKGATVVLNGVDAKCKTPRRAVVSEGDVTVQLILASYAPLVERVAVREAMTKRWRLKPKFGLLSVTSDPPGLAAQLDGEAIGTTPISARKVALGPHEVWVRDERYVDQSERVTVGAGERAAVQLTLPPRQGQLVVLAEDRAGHSEVTGAQVWVDGERVGETPFSGRVLIGARLIEVRHGAGRGAAAAQDSVRVVEGQKREVLLKLEVVKQKPGALMAEATANRPALRHIPAGQFVMGSPKDEKGDDDEIQHEVTLSEAFWMMQTEVTQGQYRAVTGESPAYFYNCGESCPVEKVSWWDAVNYANRLSAKEGLSQCYELKWCQGEPGLGCTKGRLLCFSEDYHCYSIKPVANCMGYRLPTEAQWEYAARAGTTGARHGPLNEIAWYHSTSKERTHPVGGKLANAWGLEDMLGNVSEWCWGNWRARNRGTQRDPTEPSSGDPQAVRDGFWESYVIRGGSWRVGARWIRATARRRGSSRDHFSSQGFRLLRRPQLD